MITTLCTRTANISRKSKHSLSNKLFIFGVSDPHPQGPQKVFPYVMKNMENVPPDAWAVNITGDLRSDTVTYVVLHCAWYREQNILVKQTLCYANTLVTLWAAQWFASAFSHIHIQGPLLL